MSSFLKPVASVRIVGAAQVVGVIIQNGRADGRTAGNRGNALAAEEDELRAASFAVGFKERAHESRRRGLARDRRDFGRPAAVAVVGILPDYRTTLLNLNQTVF